MNGKTGTNGRFGIVGEVPRQEDAWTMNSWRCSWVFTRRMQIVIVLSSIKERKRIMQVQSLFHRRLLPVLLLAGLSVAGFASAQETAPVYDNSITPRHSI
jgi:hypothetical protein